ncbi:cytochrome o ubiquinol oxidase subunit IV [Breoghania sp.]|uniref:cytochrome o ubiquinol oxidase subunit IV n=1 Tax=Breoghania sp. TaxID=2065378 RepID=UPI002AA89D08|nr:cytochrome o ubiquinol oxidase subunit IV [Breoghania sp.]
MSADPHALEHHDTAPSHATTGGYMAGFILSVILTAIPFGFVMSGTLDTQTTVFVIMGMAVIQIFVHMVFFLHMDAKSEGGWNLLALVFTVIIVAITLAGSSWVMYHLNTNMMPAHDMRQLP